MGVRLAIRQAQAQAGDIALLYADESEALTHPYLAHVWAEKGVDLRMQAPGASRKIAMMGALDAATRELLIHTSPTKTSADFIGLLELLDWRYGPKQGCTRRPVCWCSTTDPSTPAKHRQRHWRPGPGSPSSGCRDMPLS